MIQYTSFAISASLDRNSYFPCMGTIPKLSKPNALPRPQPQATIGDGNIE